MTNSSSGNSDTQAVTRNNNTIGVRFLRSVEISLMGISHQSIGGRKGNTYRRRRRELILAFCERPRPSLDRNITAHWAQALDFYWF